MKIILFLVFTIISSYVLSADTTVPFTPSEEKEYFENLNTERVVFKANFSIESKNKNIASWDECNDYSLRGNFKNHECTENRAISKKLLGFLKGSLIQCVGQTLDSMNYEFQDLHLVHNGIFADKRHSPESLHSLGRAIDIVAIYIKTREHGWRNYDFKALGNGYFFKRFRRCWGYQIRRYNQCPLFEGNAEQTGSIGKEDDHHQNHLHLSVPVCINNQYSEQYFRR